MKIANIITYEQADLIGHVINSFSEGGHPEATLDSLKFFQFDYVRKLAKKARPSLRPKYQQQLDEAIELLAKHNLVA